MSSKSMTKKDEFFLDIHHQQNVQLGSLMENHLSEIELKKQLIEYFKVDLKFEDGYKDLKIVIPTSMMNDHPIFQILSRFDWVYATEYADQIVVLNRAATELNLRRSYGNDV